ncbi:MULTISPECIES: WhiB family transcriptional regulator [Streptomyces]|uniref:WhiB family transcriptional regulator n=1 Tax=Streptomyces TaxID=1883 RepID=UPI00366A2989
MEHAACRKLPPPRRGQPDPFFPERGESYRSAVKVCFNCGVRPQCTEYRQRIGAEYGVWAGVMQRRQDD